MIRNGFPNSYEKKLITIMLKYHIPFFYTSNFSFFIKDRNPDFKHIKYKLLIEVYSSTHHEDNYEKQRNDFFEINGYKTLFISDDDINRLDWEKHILNKIKDFLQNSELIEDNLSYKNFKLENIDESIKIMQTNIGKYVFELYNYLKQNNIKVFEISSILRDFSYSRSRLSKIIIILRKYNIISQINSGRYTSYRVNLDKKIENLYYKDVKNMKLNPIITIYKKDECAKAIVDFLKESNINTFARKDIINIDYASDTITLALRQLKQNKKIKLLNNGGRYAYYEVI